MTELQDALATAMSVLLHEDADPDCTGEPSYFTTQEQARSLVDRTWQTPIVQAALAAPATLPAIDVERLRDAARDYLLHDGSGIKRTGEWAGDFDAGKLMDARDRLHAAIAAPAPPAALDMKRLARALVASELMARYCYYADQLPTMDRGESVEQTTARWAPLVAAAYDAERQGE